MSAAPLRPQRTAARRAAALGVLAAVVLLAGSVAAVCPYPLSEAIPRGEFVNWDSGDDPEYQMVESTIIHGQKSKGLMVEAGGDLHFFYNVEVEYELSDGSPAETQSIFHKLWNQTHGWNVTQENFAALNLTDELPQGRNVQPSGAAIGDTAWAVWEVGGAERYRPNGSYIVVRGVHGDMITPFFQAAPDDSDNINKIPAIVSTGPEAYIAFHSTWRERGLDEFHIMGRTFDGTTFGPLENISAGNDGWSDQEVALAAGGGRYFAAWVSQNTTRYTGQGDWNVQLAVRDTMGHWSPAVNITSPTGIRDDTPTLAWMGGKLYVAWSTNDPTLSTSGNPVIAMATFDPQAGTATAPILLSPSDFQGTNALPSSIVWQGRLHFLWASASTPSSAPASGSDYDIYYINYTTAGGFGTPRTISNPADNDLADQIPGFFTVGDGLYAYFLENICRPGCGHETDWRQMTRLIDRPARWYDDITAEYWVDDRGQDNATNTSFHIDFENSSGSLASPDYYMQGWNGVWLKGTQNASLFHGEVLANSSALRLVEGAYCGKVVPTAEIHLSLPDGKYPRSPFGDFVLPALVIAGVLAAFGWRALRRR